ncbi:La [Vanrija pseudolonga]|uniref:La n=1 Tax=Vanrija pseudolonga TaxID=143232 RepID=A0AAF1BKM6_9TREE|nr:La [Vanrija pseudolonga]
MSSPVKIEADAPVKTDLEATKIEVDAPEVKPEVAEVKPAVEAKPETEASPESAVKAAKQVNFYFSDSNLPTDKFFFSLTACNKEGWVPIKTILTFKRMREFKDLGVEGVAQALREAAEAEGSDPLTAVSEDGQNVRRARHFEPNTTQWGRSVYVKGFGEGESENNTQEKIEEWFAQFGKINAVRKRREDIPDKGEKGSGRGRGAFKGSVFAEFAYEADMNKFLELELVPKFTADGPDMLKMSKDAYVTMKAKEKGIPSSEIQRGKGGQPKKFNAFRELEKIKNGKPAQFANIPDTMEVVGERVTGSSRGNDRNDKKRPREDGEERAAKKERIEVPLTIEYGGVTLECDPKTGAVLDPSKLAFTDGAAIKFSAPGDGGDWKVLKNAVIEAAIASPFMAFPPGTKGGTVAKSDSTLISDEELAKLNDAKLDFGGEPVTFARMSEDEQRAFWLSRANYQGTVALRKRNEAGDGKERRGGGFHRGGGGGGRGRGGRGGRGGFQRGGGRGGGHRGGRGGHRGGRDNNGGSRNNDSGIPPTVGSVSN